MLSRRAICLWSLAVLLFVGLAVSSAVLGQGLIADTATDDPAKEPAGETPPPDPATEPAEPPKQPQYSGGYYYGGAARPQSSTGSRYTANVYGRGDSYSRGAGQMYGYRRTAPPKPDPEMEKLLEADTKMEQQTRVLAKRYREAKDQEEQAKVRGDLETLTKEHFDLRQERRELEISRLEAQLQRVRASVEKRTEVKDLIIRRRIAQILGEEDDLAF